MSKKRFPGAPDAASFKRANSITLHKIRCVPAEGELPFVAGILVPADIASIVSALACGLRPVTSQNSMLARSAGENPRLSGPGARGFAAVSRNQLSLIRSGVLGRFTGLV